MCAIFLAARWTQQDDEFTAINRQIHIHQGMDAHLTDLISLAQALCGENGWSPRLIYGWSTGGIAGGRGVKHCLGLRG